MGILFISTWQIIVYFLKVLSLPNLAAILVPLSLFMSVRNYDVQNVICLSNALSIFTAFHLVEAFPMDFFCVAFDMN